MEFESRAERTPADRVFSSSSVISRRAAVMRSSGRHAAEDAGVARSGPTIAKRSRATDPLRIVVLLTPLAPLADAILGVADGSEGYSRSGYRLSASSCGYAVTCGLLGCGARARGRDKAQDPRQPIPSWPASHRSSKLRGSFVIHHPRREPFAHVLLNGNSARRHIRHRCNVGPGCRAVRTALGPEELPYLERVNVLLLPDELKVAPICRQTCPSSACVSERNLLLRTSTLQLLHRSPLRAFARIRLRYSGYQASEQLAGVTSHPYGSSDCNKRCAGKSNSTNAREAQ